MNLPFFWCQFTGVASSVEKNLLGAYCTSKSLAEMAPIQGEDPGTVIVIMGVSGAGKSTICNLLAETINCDFLDADDFHPDSNKEKMKNGIPLSDEDRKPWLQELSNLLKRYLTAGKTVVLACSALRKAYREILRASDPDYLPGAQSRLVKFVLLDVPVEVLVDRLNKREARGEHFMPPALLGSQLALLEIDASERILPVDATESPSAIVAKIQEILPIS